MTIREKLQLAIENAEYEEYPHSAIYKLDYNKAVDGCFEVTKDIAIKFVEYLTDENSKYSIMYGGNPERLSTIDKDYTIKEVFEEFLKTL